jgi:hypothetical protein
MHTKAATRYGALFTIQIVLFPQRLIAEHLVCLANLCPFSPASDVFTPRDTCVWTYNLEFLVRRLIARVLVYAPLAQSLSRWRECSCQDGV